MASVLGRTGRAASTKRRRLRPLHRIIWTLRAQRDLTEIRAYISQFAPLAAQRLAQRLVAAAESLAEHPLQGRALSRRRRELAALPPYLIRYTVNDLTAEIITIRHGAREPERG